MKKSILFLINGLGIEKPQSYNISIDQCMPRLAHTKETSFYTSAVINSIEYRSAYERFFLGDTDSLELNYIQNNILNESIQNNTIFQRFLNNIKTPNSKIHVFLEPNNDKIVEQINRLVSILPLEKNQPVYLHLLLTQQTVGEYSKLITIINYIKYHIHSNITVGFIIGKELFTDNMTKDELDNAKKMFFYCSCERWSETEKKLESLREANVRPCTAPGFCATNSCNIENNDTILFFNTRRTSYDKFINAIYQNAESALRIKEFNLPIYSLIRLDTNHNIPCFSENIVYENSLANIMEKSHKRTLIITSEENIKLINFLANGLTYVNNPNIQFMKIDEAYLSSLNNIQTLIDTTPYDLIIFDFHMDVSKTINDLKEQLERMDIIIGNIASISENKHSLFITSLYGLKKTLPIAAYNSEMVTIDYEMQIPIFLYDYTYPRSKYILLPGDTNAILNTAIKCIWPESPLDSLLKQKGLFNNLFKK